jgi:predicted ATP-dependent Lon-type protease
MSIKDFYLLLSIFCFSIAMILLIFKLTGIIGIYKVNLLGVSGKGNVFPVICIIKSGTGKLFVNIPPEYAFSTQNSINKMPRFSDKDIFIIFPEMKLLEGSSLELGLRLCIEGALGNWNCDNCAYTGGLEGNKVVSVDMLSKKLLAAQEEGIKKVYIPFSQTVFVVYDGNFWIFDTRKFYEETNVEVIGIYEID